MLQLKNFIVLRVQKKGFQHLLILKLAIISFLYLISNVLLSFLFTGKLLLVISVLHLFLALFILSIVEKTKIGLNEKYLVASFLFFVLKFLIGVTGLLPTSV